MQNTRKVNIFTLSVVFVFCFLASIYIVTKFFVAEAPEASQEQDDSRNENNRERLFPLSIPISKEGKFLSVNSTPDILPAHKKDYLLFFWVNLRSLPEVGERLVLLSKYSGEPPRIQGFAVGLKRDINSLRPVLFWGDGSAAGRWYDFPEISIAAKEWNLFALHVHKEKFVGMYTARITSGSASSVKFLGGHEIALEDPLNLGSADLVFGAPSGREFRGRLGPLAVINPLSIGFEDLSESLQAYVKAPQDFSLLGLKSEYQLLIEDGRVDSSEAKNKVVTSY